MLIKKIKNTKQSRIFWIISGLYKVLDGLVSILSFGYYAGEFNLTHIIKAKNK